MLDKCDDHCQVIQEMFASVPDCGLTVLAILDNQLQKFFEMVSDVDDATKAGSKERNYLHSQASDFLEGSENRRPPSVVIPQCLRSTPPTAPKDVGGDEGPAAKKRKRAAKKATDDESPVTNKEPQQAWSIPEGKAFADCFAGAQGNDSGWPKLTDVRFDTKRNMCPRFQVKGACTKDCTLAHTVKSKMSASQEAEISTRFKKIFGK